MGCISSKLISTSVSFQEKVNHNQQKSANSLHHALQELTISAKINNHFTAVSSPNKLGFRSCSRKCSKLSISLMHILLNNTPSKFKSRVDQGGQDTARTSRVHTIKRSKSCGSFSENEELCSESSDGVEKTWDRKGRSFHTVEEYDAMIQQIKHLVEDDCSFAADGIDKPEKRESDLNHNDGSGTTKDSPKPGKGFRRKFIAKSLESLEIPHSIEFPIVGPEAYVTPKFGSYSLPNCATPNEEVFFDPQLVADFEQCMQQLEAETQAILSQISDNLDQNHAKEEFLLLTEP